MECANRDRCSLHIPLFANVGKPLFQDGVNVVISKRVIDVLAGTFRFHQMRLLENSKLVRNRALGCINCFCDMGNAKLAPHQSKQDFYASSVGKHFEQVGKIVKGFFRWSLVENAILRGRIATRTIGNPIAVCIGRRFR